jgi:hypothetical protein
MNKGMHKGVKIRLSKMFDTILCDNFTKKQTCIRLVQSNTCSRHNNHGGLS